MAICGNDSHLMTMEWYEARKEKNRYRMNSKDFITKEGVHFVDYEMEIEPKVEVLIVNRFNDEYDMIYYKSRSFWNEFSDEFIYDFYIRIIDEDVLRPELLLIMPNAKVYYPGRTIMSLLSAGDKIKWHLGMNLMMNKNNLI